MRYLKIESFL